MRGYRDFMVHLPVKLNDTFKTESGLEIYASKSFSQKRLANTIVEVREIPFEYDGEIEPGDTVFVDSTIMMEQTYTIGGQQENINEMDRVAKIYKVPSSLIIAYKKKGSEQWVLNDINVLLERIPEEVEQVKSSLIYIPENKQQKFKRSIAKLAFDIPEYDLKKGDTVHFKELTMVEVWLDSKPLLWLRKRDLMAVLLNEVA